jgi:hypothetical protein
MGQCWAISVPRARCASFTSLRMAAAARLGSRTASTRDPQGDYISECAHATSRRLVKRSLGEGWRTLPALEASHIQPFAKDGPHEVSNSVLIGADLHRLPATRSRARGRVAARRARASHAAPRTGPYSGAPRAHCAT